VVGGGVVGLSIAYGLARLGKRVLVLDEGDSAVRASRGNFGLVWVQGKGAHAPDYAKWSQLSAAAWSGYADQLQSETDQPLGLRQDGGYSFFTCEQELESCVEKYKVLKEQIGGDYPFEVLGHNALHKEEPEIGPDVIGAVLHHQDGHVNPLRLLQSLSEVCRRRGVGFHLDSHVDRITPTSTGFSLFAGDAEHRAEKVVLCAGLGSSALANDLGFKAPLQPNRGQVLITEKLPPMINRPSLVARQVDEGGIQIGASEENAGMDDTDSLAITSQLAKKAIQTFPVLGQVSLIRHWSALRVMSPDGLPIYQQSTMVPGAFFVTCHSGITLSAAHAQLLPLWLIGDPAAPDLGFFSENRFSGDGSNV